MGSDVDGLWGLYGFRDNPYRFTELTPDQFDDGLYTSRGRAEAEFASAVTDANGGVLVISGDYGTGKTSFANILQHRLFNGTAGFGLRPMPAYERTSFQKGDSPTILARRILENVIRSVERHCSVYHLKVPSETRRYKNWVFGGATQAANLAGVGLTVSPVMTSTVEACCEILNNIVNECRLKLKVDGLFICLDNAENLEDIGTLSILLKDIRDSLLSIPKIWWIIIGQSDLYHQIERHNAAIAERIVGSGIQLDRLDVEEFHALIERRVRGYGKRPGAKAPLSRNIHNLLHEAAADQIRFALHLGHTVLYNLNRKMYQFVEQQYSDLGRRPEGKKLLLDVLSLLRDRMGGADAFPDEYVMSEIELISRGALRRLLLPLQVCKALQLLSEAPFTQEQFLKIAGEQFSSFEYLDQLTKDRVVKKIDGDTPSWSLRHHAALLARLGDLASAAGAAHGCS
ncbi:MULTISPECIES: hypothetical protein [unclassified Bradyrhizobium]|uniref:hypothetical protein n=1 Tax=unclassified Bradyrhizobium TaxID=2631580 RepID=UPI0029170059|nr:MULTISPECIES: hypothetical protein [unclassified Bradyrhizobium]